MLLLKLSAALTLCMAASAIYSAESLQSSIFVLPNRCIMIAKVINSPYQYLNNTIVNIEGAEGHHKSSLTIAEPALKNFLSACPTSGKAYYGKIGSIEYIFHESWLAAPYDEEKAWYIPNKPDYYLIDNDGTAIGLIND